MQIYTPKDPNEYMDLVDQAIFEIDEIMACAGDEDGEDFALNELMPIFEFLDKELRQLDQDLRSGAHHFGEGRVLPFAEITESWGGRIPCTDVLRMIISIYKKGFED
ncbi:MAG: hypothetical protein IME93_00710 [Proteobacteria bacterium]|nr:hypothetical protein [Pseudomonadota bacterium]